MKNYLIDVPVKTTIWTRPECQRRQFDVLKKVRPSKLFLVSDGGRNEYEWKLINQNRKMFETEIDWDCQVFKLYENENIGVWHMINIGHEFVWKYVEECIFLEDDDVPAITFFQFCKEMLDKYRDDLRIGMITGSNPLDIYEDCPYDYFFSHIGGIWGVATWKRVYDTFSLDFYNNEYDYERILKNLECDRTFKRTIISVKNKGSYDNHIPTDEFYYNIGWYLNTQLWIVPKVNMISNIGFTQESAHSGAYETIPKGLRCIFGMDTHEMQFPLNHPRYKLGDIIYEKRINKIFANNMPIKSAYRRIERIYYQIRTGQTKNMVKRYIGRKFLGKEEK